MARWLLDKWGGHASAASLSLPPADGLDVLSSSVGAGAGSLLQGGAMVAFSLSPSWEGYDEPRRVVASGHVGRVSVPVPLAGVHPVPAVIRAGCRSIVAHQHPLAGASGSARPRRVQQNPAGVRPAHARHVRHEGAAQGRAHTAGAPGARPAGAVHPLAHGAPLRVPPLLRLPVVRQAVHGHVVRRGRRPLHPPPPSAADGVRRGAVRGGADPGAALHPPALHHPPRREARERAHRRAGSPGAGGLRAELGAAAARRAHVQRVGHQRVPRAGDDQRRRPRRAGGLSGSSASSCARC